MSTGMQERQQKILKEFQNLGSWEAKYKHLIQLGKELGEQEKSLYQDQFLVKGCQSRVWLHASLGEKGEMLLAADSDALITKGLVALLVRFYSGASPEEILATSASFLDELGFREHLSPSRANGLLSMLKQIHLYAQAFVLTRLAKT